VSEVLPPPDPARFPHPLDAAHIRVLPQRIRLGRIYFAGGAYPSSWNAMRRYGPTTSRFDQQPEQPAPMVHPGMGIMYVAPSAPVVQDPLLVALLECFRDTGTINTRTGDPHFAIFSPTRDLRLLDLADSDWIARAGGTAALVSGPRAPARAWARAINDEYGESIDGLLYPSSNDPSRRSAAIWERTLPILPAHPRLNLPLRHPALADVIDRYARDYGFAVI
jgi:hypothetical protein